ncbi:LOW QUALITY PROTEIN: facilitated trehalose transporter Tret1-like [Armigeres subalbatus]|uniref:LOW QUALITY PROTEIN: facilitated trehalose transporter Tret1-like n=1 Tax=Armigeres subalbatus TaxID=124917 RepID=UPI002ED2EC2E
MGEKIEPSNGVFNQVFSVCTINLIHFAHGATLGWLSPFLPLLQSDDSPLDTGPVTVEQASWIGSILCLGALVGAIIYGSLTSRLGVKRCISCIIFPNMSFWMIVYFGTSVYHLYIARFLAGVTGGGVIVTFPLFIADISDSRIRGMLGSCWALSRNLGILVMYIIGDILSYRTVPTVMMVVPLLFGILMYSIPETPQSLLKKRKIIEAEKSLQFFRGVTSKTRNTEYKFQHNFEELQNFILTSKTEHTKLQLSDFVSPQARKGLFIGIFLLFLNQFCGVFAILTYAVSIFQESGSNMSPGASAIIIAAIQIVGTVASFIFIDLTGRKVLLLISTFGTGLGVSCLGTFSWLKERQFDLSGYGWIPIVSLSVMVFLFCVGLCNIPFFIIPEILPTKICNVGNTISMILTTVFAFVVLKILPILLKEIKLYGATALFACTCFVGVIVIAAIVPETKGKNLVTTVDI